MIHQPNLTHRGQTEHCKHNIELRVPDVLEHEQDLQCIAYNIYALQAEVSWAHARSKPLTTGSANWPMSFAITLGTPNSHWDYGNYIESTSDK